MAALQTSANSVRAAVGSISTCTPSTTTILSELLLPKSNAQTPNISTKAKSKKPTGLSQTRGPKSTKATSVKPRSRVLPEDVEDHEEQLSPKERSILATEVINA